MYVEGNVVEEQYRRWLSLTKMDDWASTGKVVVMIYYGRIKKDKTILGQSKDTLGAGIRTTNRKYRNERKRKREEMGEKK